MTWGEANPEGIMSRSWLYRGFRSNIGRLYSSKSCSSLALSAPATGLRHARHSTKQGVIAQVRAVEMSVLDPRCFTLPSHGWESSLVDS